MSNQVFANNTQRYFPATEQKDTFSLTKDQVGPPAFGSRPFPLQQAGSPIQFNRLNGVDLTAGGSGWPYSSVQSASTKSCWTLSCSPTSSSALSLTSNINNTIAVECIMPGTITGFTGGPYPVKLCLMLLNDINSFTTAKVVAMDQRDILGTPNPPTETWQFSTVVNMAAGQVLQLWVFVGNTLSNGAWVTMDDANGLSRILIESSLSFTKL